jgi:two-component system sensor histidine kinase UhpB
LHARAQPYGHNRVRFDTDVLDAAFDQAVLGMALVDLEGRYLRVNPALCRLLGRSASELVGCSVLDVTDPRDIDRSRTMLADARGGGQPTYELEKRYVHADGHPVWVVLSVALLRDAAGTPTCFLGQVLDISERKRAETERQRLLARLASAQQDERARVARELHDGLGQQLTSVALLAKGLEADAPRDLAVRLARLRQLAEASLGAARRLASTLRPVELDGRPLREVLGRLAHEVAELAGLRLAVDVAGLPCALSHDVEGVVYRVAQEALTNVLRHAAASSVSVVVRHSGGSLELLVEDDGKGFDRHVPSRRGLGLAHMAERAAAVGGELTVESPPGAGTAVRLTLPCRAKAQ